MSWHCSICGTEHDELPTVYGAPAPWKLQGVSDEEFEGRVELTDDLCMVDDKQFFVCGLIELPIHDDEEVFAWSAWCSLADLTFDHMMSRWDAKDREKDPPIFGWLMTALPGYPDTLKLKTHVRTRAPGIAPLIEREQLDHPLASEQRDGIDWRRVEEIAHLLLGHD